MKRLSLVGISLLTWLVVAVLAGPSYAKTASVYTKQLLVNGNFTDNLNSWTLTKVDTTTNIDTQIPLDGNYVTLGNIGETEMITQVITVPKDAGKVTLDFYYRFYTNDNTTKDYATFGVFGETADDDYVLIRYAADGDNTDWTYTSVDLSRYAGDTITVAFAVANDNASITFADFDSVLVTAQSNGVLKGTATANGAAWRKAKIRITNANDKLLWKGTTNKQGKFSVSLRGSDKDYTVKISKDGSAITKKVAITWAKVTKQTFQSQ